jgi:hypothetical protein
MTTIKDELVPVVVEQTSRGERSFDIYSRLLSERIVFLGTPIDDNVGNLILTTHARGDSLTGGRFRPAIWSWCGASSTERTCWRRTLSGPRSWTRSSVAGSAVTTRGKADRTGRRDGVWIGKRGTGISSLPQVSALNQRPNGGHHHENPRQERATANRAHERSAVARDPDMKDEHDHQERYVPADEFADNVAKTRGHDIVRESARPRDRPPPGNNRHGGEDREGRRQGRKDDPEHDPQLRRKKPQPRMNKCQPSQSHRPNTRNRPKGTVMKDRKKSDIVGQSGPRTRPMACQTKSAPTIPSQPTNATALIPITSVATSWILIAPIVRVWRRNTLPAQTSSRRSTIDAWSSSTGSLPGRPLPRRQRLNRDASNPRDGGGLGCRALRISAVVAIAISATAVAPLDVGALSRWPETTRARRSAR